MSLSSYKCFIFFIKQIRILTFLIIPGKPMRSAIKNMFAGED